MSIGLSKSRNRLLYKIHKLDLTDFQEKELIYLVNFIFDNLTNDYISRSIYNRTKESNLKLEKLNKELSKQRADYKRSLCVLNGKLDFNLDKLKQNI